jgi:hypothetical protein
MSKTLNSVLIGMAILIAGSTSIHTYAQDSLDTPNIDRWGFDVGFGQQPYMEDVGRIGILSPFIFEALGSNWRLTLDMVGRRIQNQSPDEIAEYSLSLESNSPVYKDIAYSYVKFGVGLMDPHENLYDGSIFTVPLTLGLNVITFSRNQSVLSYFVEYRFNVYRDYTESKSLPNQAGATLDEEVFFSGVTSLGIRFLF